MKETEGAVYLAPMVSRLENVSTGVDRIAAKLTLERLKAEIDNIQQSIIPPMRAFRYGAKYQNFNVVKWSRTMDEKEVYQGNNLEELIQRLDREISDFKKRHSGNRFTAVLAAVRSGEWWEEQVSFMEKRLNLLKDTQPKLKSIAIE